MYLLEGFENCIIEKGERFTYSLALILKQLAEYMTEEEALDYYYFNIEWLTNKHIIIK